MYVQALHYRKTENPNIAASPQISHHASCPERLSCGSAFEIFYAIQRWIYRNAITEIEFIFIF